MSLNHLDCEANDEGATPVFAAAKNGHKACVHLLLQAGADRYKARGNDFGE